MTSWGVCEECGGYGEIRGICQGHSWCMNCYRRITGNSITKPRRREKFGIPYEKALGDEVSVKENLVQKLNKQGGHLKNKLFNGWKLRRKTGICANCKIERLLFASDKDKGLSYCKNCFEEKTGYERNIRQKKPENYACYKDRRAIRYSLKRIMLAENATKQLKGGQQEMEDKKLKIVLNDGDECFISIPEVLTIKDLPGILTKLQNIQRTFGREMISALAKPAAKTTFNNDGRIRAGHSKCKFLYATREEAVRTLAAYYRDKQLLCTRTSMPLATIQAVVYRIRKIKYPDITAAECGLAEFPKGHNVLGKNLGK